MFGWRYPPIWRRDEWNVSTRRRRDLERSVAVLSIEHSRLLVAAWRDLWQLGRNDTRRHSRDGRPVADHWGQAKCPALAGVARLRRLYSNRRCDHIRSYLASLGAANEGVTGTRTLGASQNWSP